MEPFNEMVDTTDVLATPTARIGRRRWYTTPSGREALWGVIFVSPWLLGLALFTVGPMIASLVFSMTDFDLVHAEDVQFIGFDNYVRMASDPLVIKSLVVTFRFAIIAIPLTMFASLGVALLLNSPRLFGRSVLRTLFYMPIQIPLVASTLVWIGFLNPETGWLNGILAAFGMPGPDWLNNETWIYPALSLIGLWGIGNFMLINIAGLQSVPTELYEAARIDGAGPGTMFRRITIPLMSPILLYNLVISLVVTFQYFTQAYTSRTGAATRTTRRCSSTSTCSGKPSSSTRWATAPRSAGSLFPIVLVLTLAIFAFARKRVYYAGGEG